MAQRPSVISKNDLVAEHGNAQALLQRYEVVKELGKGSFGSVKLVRERATDLERVIKVCNTEGLATQTLVTMQREIQLLQELDHPHIVKIFEFADDAREQKLYLCLEKLDGGDGDGLLQKGGPLQEALVARLMQQVLSATAYCHQRGIMHRDLKPENIMILKKREGLSSWIRTTDCKVIDFGLASRFERRGGPDQVDTCGTPAYMAPEVVDMEGPYGARADVWSIGVTAYQMLTNELPFGRPGDYKRGFWEVFDRVKRYNDDIDFDAECWEDRSDEAKDFVESLMTRTDSARPSAREALHHPWLQENGSSGQDQISLRTVTSLEGYARAPHLVRVCLLLIASRLSETELKKFRRRFISLDPEGDGYLTPEVLEEALRERMGCWGLDVDFEQIFDAMDLDQSGSISYTEFVAACLHSKLRSFDGRKLSDRAFYAMDVDGDGLLSIGQLQEFLTPGASVPLLDHLPRDRTFDAQEFYQGLKNSDVHAPTPWHVGWRFIRPVLCCKGDEASDSEEEIDLSQLEASRGARSMRMSRRY